MCAGNLLQGIAGENDVVAACGSVQARYPAQPGRIAAQRQLERRRAAAQPIEQPAVKERGLLAPDVLPERASEHR